MSLTLEKVISIGQTCLSSGTGGRKKKGAKK